MTLIQIIIHENQFLQTKTPTKMTANSHNPAIHFSDNTYANAGFRSMI